MTKIQIDFDDSENKIINIYKAKIGFITKAEAVRAIIKLFGLNTGKK